MNQIVLHCSLYWTLQNIYWFYLIHGRTHLFQSVLRCSAGRWAYLIHRRNWSRGKAWVLWGKTGRRAASGRVRGQSKFVVLSIFGSAEAEHPRSSRCFRDPREHNENIACVRSEQTSLESSDRQSVNYSWRWTTPTDSTPSTLQYTPTGQSCRADFAPGAYLTACICWSLSLSNILLESQLLRWSCSIAVRPSWWHPQNRKYITNGNATRGIPSHSHRQNAQKFGELWP